MKNTISFTLLTILTTLSAPQVSMSSSGAIGEPHSSPAVAAVRVLHVPRDYSSIQAAVDAAPAQMDDDEIGELMMRLMGGGLEMADFPPALFAAASASVAALGYPDGSGSIDVPGATATRAFGINALGDIVGSYADASGTHGYLLTNGTFTTIDVPFLNVVSTEAWGINPLGDIVGRYRKGGDPKTYGFLLSKGIFTDISVGGHLHTLPIKVSPNGEIVGCFHDSNFLADMRGYVQRGDRIRTFEAFSSSMHNGITPGGGLIAGLHFETSTRVRSYTVLRDVVTQFDFPGATFTQAWDVGATGTVVGYYNMADSHGFVLDARGFTSVDIPGAAWTRIFGIGPQGDLVGTYMDGSGVHGFLLRGREGL